MQGFQDNDLITVNRNPRGESADAYREGASAAHAVNSVSAALDIPWQDVVRVLMERAVHYGLMPTQQRCIRGMLTHFGFVEQPAVLTYGTAEDTLMRCRRDFRNSEKAVICCGNGSYAAVCREEEEESGQYVLMALSDIRRQSVRELWIRWPDGKSHGVLGGVARAPKQERKVTARTSHKGYEFNQENPQNNSIGDCVIRGIATACGISWQEALMGIARTDGFCSIVLNVENVFTRFLAEQGFKLHNRLKVNGRLLTGREFCREMTLRCSKGESVFAFNGRNHVVAMLPVPTDNDRGFEYRIFDNWDSSDRKTGDFWIREPARPPVLLERLADELIGEDTRLVSGRSGVCAGMRVLHPVYGEGRITEVNGDRDKCMIRFAQYEGCFQTAWLLDNGYIISEESGRPS